MWGLDHIGAPEVWNAYQDFSGVTGDGITIAVVDTGIDLDHPEFAGRIVPGYDFDAALETIFLKQIYKPWLDH